VNNKRLLFFLFPLIFLGLFYTFLPKSIVTCDQEALYQEIDSYIQEHSGFLKSVNLPTLDNRKIIHQHLNTIEDQLRRKFSLKTIYLILFENTKQLKIVWNQAIPDSIYRLSPDRIKDYHFFSLPIDSSITLQIIAPKTLKEHKNAPALRLLLLILFSVFIIYLKSKHPLAAWLLTLAGFIIGFMLPMENPPFIGETVLFFYPGGIITNHVGLLISSWMLLLMLRIFDSLKSKYPNHRLPDIIFAGYSLLLVPFALLSSVGVLIDNGQRLWHYSNFYPSATTVVIQIIFAICIYTLFQWMLCLTEKSRMKRLYVFLYGILIVALVNEWLIALLAGLLILIVWIRIKRFHFFLPIFWGILLFFFSAVIIHQWLLISQTVHNQSKFFFKHKNISYLQKIKKVEEKLNMEGTSDISAHLPMGIIDKNKQSENTFNLPYPYAWFWTMNRWELQSEPLLKMYYFYFENQTFYYLTWRSPNNRIFFIPYLEKNCQYWLDHRLLYHIVPEDIRFMEELPNRFFSLNIAEYHRGALLAPIEENSKQFPYNARELKLVNHVGKLMIPIQDDDIDGHYVAIALTFPPVYQSMATILKLLVLLIIFFFLFHTLWHLELGAFKYDKAQLQKIVHSIQTRFIFIQLLLSLGLLVSLFYVARQEINQKFKRNLINLFQDQQEALEQYFHQKISNVEQFIPNLTLHDSLLTEKENQLDFKYILFHGDGMLWKRNLEFSLLKESHLIQLERCQYPYTSLEIINNQLTLLLFTPLGTPLNFYGKGLFLIPVHALDMLYLFEKTGLTFTFFLQADNALLNERYSFVHQFPASLSFDTYLKLLVPEIQYQIKRWGENTCYFAKTQLFNESTHGYLALMQAVNYEELLAIQNQFFVIYCLLITLILTLTIYLTRRITRHIQWTARVVPAILAGESIPPLPVTGKDESAELVRAINHLNYNLQKSQSRMLVLERERMAVEFAREIAHEIKNPLTPIKLSLQQLNELFNTDRPAFLDWFPKIYPVLNQQINILGQLSQKFLQFSKYEIAPSQPVFLQEILNPLFDLYRGNPDIELTIENQFPQLSIMADVDSMSHLFQNLIKNSREASHKKPVHITLTIKPDTHYCLISIQDDGPGIPLDLQQRIFTPYITTKIQGSGLGLAISKKIALAHHGNLELIESDEKGTLFLVSIPLQAYTE